MGYKVLLIDNDPQSNLSQSLNINLQSDLEETVYQLYEQIRDEEEPTTKDFIWKHLPGYPDELSTPHLLPNGPLSISIDMAFSMVPNRERILTDILAPVRELYDICIIDNSPSLSLAVQNALSASNVVLIPTVTRFLDSKGIALFQSTVNRYMRRLNPALGIAGILITQHDRTPILSRELEQFLRDEFGELVFSTTIPKNIALSEAQAKGLYIGDYDPESKAAISYIEAAKELIERITE